MTTSRWLIPWGIFVAFALLLTGSVESAAQSSAPALAQQVEILRTQYGVPHVKGQTLAAAAFGMGYCQAEDHLLTIMGQMISARGESAKYFGGRRNVERDFFNRQFRIYSGAVERYHRIDPDIREMLDAYAEGFNYYLEGHRNGLPEWVGPINGHDVAAKARAGIMGFAFNQGALIRGSGDIQRFIRQQRSEAAVHPDEEPLTFGSNMWAFAPERTVSGKAILMGNPHLPWTPNFHYYEAHLLVPGQLNFYGSTHVGGPFLSTGFNEYLGWSYTVNFPNLEEIYELDADPEKPNHYLFDGGSVALWNDEATVEYKDGDGLGRETRTFWYSPLGPVIYRTDSKIYVIKSATYESQGGSRQPLAMLQAKNFKEFRAALDMQGVPMFNLCYADRDGTIYYLWNGTVPVLPHEARNDSATHATRSSEIWTQIHPVSDLPQLLNPKGGYVQNSNDPPHYTNLHEVLDTSRFPPYFPRPRLGLRTQHSLELIHNERRFSLEDVRDMKFSMRMLLAERVKDDLIRALDEANPEGEVKEAVALLKQWDNSVSAQSRGSVLFETWWRRYARSSGYVPAGNRTAFASNWTPEDPMATPRGLGDRERAVEAFGWALEETRNRHGAWDVAWGDVHRLRRGGVDLPIGGASGSLGAFRVLTFKRAEDGKRVANNGDSWVFAVEFSTPPRAYSVVAYSESGNVDSPHFSDQSVLFANNQMKKVAFTEEQIAEQLIAAYRPGEEASESR